MTACLTNSGQPTPRLWLRYVDDTFVVLSELDNFFQIINKQDQNIKFMQEECIANQSTLTTIYSLGHTNRLFTSWEWYSLCNTGQTLSLAIPVKSRKKRTRSKVPIWQVWLPQWAFHKATKPRNKRDSADATHYRSTARVTIPYVAGLSKRLKNTFKSFGITALYKPSNTLQLHSAHR